MNINEIKTHFSSCLTKVSNGETVIVCKRNVPIAEIRPIAALPNKKRPIRLTGNPINQCSEITGVNFFNFRKDEEFPWT